MISKNGTGGAIIIIYFVLKMLGIEPVPGSVEAIVFGAAALYALVLIAWHQLERPDSIWFIFKRGVE